MNNDKAPKNEKQKLYTAFCVIGTIFLILFFISNQSSLTAWFGKWAAILNPVIIGFIIAYLCNPIYRKFREKYLAKISSAKLRKALALIITYVIVLAIIALLLVIIVPQVISSYDDLASKFESYVSTATKWANDIIINSSLFNGEYNDIFDFLDANNVAERITSFISNSGEIMKTAVSYMIKYGSNFIVGIKDFLMGFLISIYVLLFKEHLAKITKRLIRSLMSREKYDMIIKRTVHADATVGNYLVGTIVDALCVAVMSIVSFSIFGIPYAPLVAVIVGVTDVIPFFGPIIGAVPSGFIILIANPDKLLLFIILIVIIQQIDGNLLKPLILGSHTGLTSLGIIIAITVCGGYFGILGMFIGVPLVAMIYDVISENVNAKLKEIDDPEFPPDYDVGEKKDKKYSTTLKKSFTAIISAIVKFAKLICGGIKKLALKIKKK